MECEMRKHSREKGGGGRERESTEQAARAYPLECGDLKSKPILMHAFRGFLFLALPGQHPDGTRICARRATKGLPHGHCGTSRRGDRILLQLEGTRTALSIAEPVFRSEILSDPAGFRRLCQARRKEAVFIFVDNSNIFISAQFRDKEEGGDRDLAVRLSVPSLCDVARLGRQPKTQFVAGSHSRPAPPSWQASYENEGFKVYVEQRRPRGNEQGVDDALHAQAMDALGKDFGAGRLSQTLILMTGDGNDNHERVSFPSVVVQAMKVNADRGESGRDPLWKVEIVCWERALSGRLRDLRDQYPEFISIRFLDMYRDYVTFRDRRQVS